MGQEEETERPINNSEIIALRQKVMGPAVAVRASRKSQILDAHTHTHTHLINIQSVSSQQKCQSIYLCQLLTGKKSVTSCIYELLNIVKLMSFQKL